MGGHDRHVIDDDHCDNDNAVVDIGIQRQRQKTIILMGGVARGNA